ncbi:response regulator [Kocuria sp. M1R5S2]|uniref:response regulator n=1 Tax=Kocuria rhizosphaerae TaxID=3376285 RepID=UPI0037AE2B12
MTESRRILVIDDDEGIREVAHASLELVGGHDVTTAGSGAEGLEVSSRNPPDVILLDVMMPGLDGPATFARLRQNTATRDVPVLLLTAKAQETDRRRFADLGVDGVLTKPFDPLSLPEQVAELLGWDP